MPTINWTPAQLAEMIESQTFDRTIAGVNCFTRFANLPLESIAFLLDYGAKQYYQDGAAVETKDDDDKPLDADTVRAAKEAGVKNRLDNVAKGEFKRSGSRTTDPAEKHRNAILDDIIKAACKEKGVTFSKLGKEKIAELRTAYYAARKEKVDAEVAKRMESADLGDLSDLVNLI